MSTWPRPCPSMIEPMHVRSPPSQRWQPTKAASCVVLRAPPVDLQNRRGCWSFLKIYQLQELPKRVVPIRMGSLLVGAARNRTEALSHNISEDHVTSANRSWG